MYTISKIAEILNADVINGKNNMNNVITNFEYIFSHVNSKQTAFISISKTSWKDYLKRPSSLQDGNSQVNKNQKEVGLIITEKIIEELSFDIPQLLVENSIDAMKTLALNIRRNYKNKILCLTGSMGKTSTRLMLKAGLSPLKVLDNRGNSNTRVAIYLQMCKLASNPDIAIFELSLNALNNRGNMSQLLKPNVTVLTGIGAAHLSTIATTEEIADFKTRIFKGLSSNGIAIYNKDSIHSNYIRNKALENTSKVYCYSINDNQADLKVDKIEHIKKGMLIKISGGEKIKCSFISKGMIQNFLAAVLTLKKLNIDVTDDRIKKMAEVNFLKKVLEFKTIQTLDRTVTLIDDTHNASLPAMLNAIKAFDNQSTFFNGNKIIAIGQISDLGERTSQVHKELIQVLSNSTADHILCMDQPLKSVVGKINNKNITWYADYQLMLLDLEYLTTADSLVLLKSSVTKTDFPQVAHQLPYRIMYGEGDIYESGKRFPRIYPSYMVVDIESMTVIEESNREHSATLEGLTPILYYIESYKKEVFQDEKIVLAKWPTNDLEFYEGRAFRLGDIIESMCNSPHPSLIYQLSKELYKGSNISRKKSIRNIIQICGLRSSSSVNVTGRFRNKERQSFTIDDILNLIIYYKKLLLKKEEFILGENLKHGFISRNGKIIIFTGFNDIDDASKILKNTSLNK